MISRVELEISSDCNAACPGCARTQNIDLVKVLGQNYCFRKGFLAQNIDFVNVLEPCLKHVLKNVFENSFKKLLLKTCFEDFKF